MKILYLTLHGKWFDMILTGEKKEEYRECKPYWVKRFTKPEFHNIGELGMIAGLSTGEAFRTDFDIVHFSHGYRKGCRKMMLELKGLSYRMPADRRWTDDNPDNFYIVLELGKIISFSKS